MVVLLVLFKLRVVSKKRLYTWQQNTIKVQYLYLLHKLLFEMDEWSVRPVLQELLILFLRRAESPAALRKNYLSQNALFSIFPARIPEG